MHVPPATARTVDPDTVHTVGVLEVNDTASPDDADADKATDWPTGTPGWTTSDGSVKLIVCAACPVVTWNGWATSGAAA